MRSWFYVLGILAASGMAHAQPALQERLKSVSADPAALKQAVEAGKKASFFCANCHGEDGISKSPEVPNLAGQNPAYLLEQIRKFGSGERKDPFMQGLIKVLKDDERLQITLYYAGVSVRPSSADPVQVARGKGLFDKLCVRCHGEQAHGNDAYPRLAGQKLPYLQTSIARYRDQTGVRNNQLMSIATAPLKNEDIVAIAHYLTQLP
ncbi:c-type cytochrome [Dechloromonas denitrificans]|uniref:c-type cytochrome n=1 Tax=Dechloromonas denitrificans TaxID=281362 RepID=UPI001CF7EF11|nr:c-type cytochrome [Dechloromonas denitrificans]UCV12368.1 c-type cytochrome [Dechloromonas denitrificans]